MSFFLLGWPLYFWVALLGLVLGSFLNSWIWRTYENIRVVAGRSICVTCGHKIVWYDNIPLLSYLFLRGKCRICHHPIPWHYPLVELTTAVAFLLISFYHVNQVSFDTIRFFRDIFFVVLLIVIFVYDGLYKIILPGLVWLGTIIGFLFNHSLVYSLPTLLLGGAVGGGFFLAQFLISRGRWIGGGDVRMGVLMGVWLGWPLVGVGLFLAYILGALWALFLLSTKKKTLGSEVPFGTFLSLATVATLYSGNFLLTWYLSLLKG